MGHETRPRRAAGDAHAHDHGGTGSFLSGLFNRLIGPFLSGGRGQRNRWLLLAGILLLIGASMMLVVTQAVVLKMLPFDNKSEFQVNLVDKHHRDERSHAIALALREPLQAIAERLGGNAKLVEIPGPPVLSPLVAEVYGIDYQGQTAIARQVRAVFADTADIVDIDDSVEHPGPKALVVIDRAKAARLGVAQASVAEALQTVLGGEDMSFLHGANVKYAVPIRVEYSDADKADLEQVLALGVRSEAGDLVPLSEIVTVVETTRAQSIHHKDLLPVVYVLGDMAGATDSPLYGLFAISARLTDALGLPQWYASQPSDPYQYSVKWDGEWQVTYDTFRDMGIAYGVGLVLIYLLVVAQFRSYLVPLVIMAPIPLTIIGILPGHALLGARFTPPPRPIFFVLRRQALACSAAGIARPSRHIGPGAPPIASALRPQGADQQRPVAVAHVLAADDVDRLLGDVGGVVADALEGVGDGEHGGQGLAAGQAGVGEQGPGEGGGGGVQALVVVEDADGLVQVGAGHGLDGAIEHAAGDGVVLAQQPRQRLGQDPRRGFEQPQGAAGDAGGLIAGALELADRLGDGEHQAQVHGGGLATGDDAEHLLVGGQVEAVDLGLAVEHLVRRGGVAVEQGVHRALGLVDGVVAHLGDQGEQVVEVAVVGADDVAMLVGAVHVSRTCR